MDDGSVWVSDFEEGKMMKKTFVSIILGVVLYGLACWLTGCSTEQPGETTAEGHRRHLRNIRLNQQEMMEDVDKVLLFDKPSRLTDKTVQ